MSITIWLNVCILRRSFKCHKITCQLLALGINKVVYFMRKHHLWDQKHYPHSLWSEHQFLLSVRRYRALPCRLNRYKHSFIPQSITALNKHPTDQQEQRLIVVLIVVCVPICVVNVEMCNKRSCQQLMQQMRSFRVLPFIEDLRIWSIFY